MFRCVDCEGTSRWATMTTEAQLDVEMEDDGHLTAEINWAWDIDEQNLGLLRCSECGGEVEIVSK